LKIKLNIRWDKMASRNQLAMVLAIVAGVLLILSGVNGLGMWEMIKGFVTKYLIDHIAVQLLFAVIIFIASLGGIAVIIGGLLIGKERITTGKLLIMLGTGMGIIGLAASIVVDWESGNFSINRYYSAGTIGIVLSVAVRMIAGASYGPEPARESKPEEAE
jgi:hypothetical protein